MAVQDVQGFLASRGVDSDSIEHVLVDDEHAEQFVALLYPDSPWDVQYPEREPGDNATSALRRLLPYRNSVVADGYFFVHAIAKKLDVTPEQACGLLDGPEIVALGDVFLVLRIPRERISVLLCLVAAGKAACLEHHHAIARKTYEDTRPAALETVASAHQHPVYPWPPTGQTFQKRLGNGYYADAVQSLGLVANSGGRERGLLLYSEQDYITAVTDFLTEQQEDSRPTSYGAYLSWVKNERHNGKKRPTGPAIRLHFRTWQRAKDAGQNSLTPN